MEVGLPNIPTWERVDGLFGVRFTNSETGSGKTWIDFVQYLRRERVGVVAVIYEGPEALTCYLPRTREGTVTKWLSDSHVTEI